ncbi:hypothetical protein D9758_010941 [Tetrapyrgos nigripes]|uniref:DUF6534 domain-containing protein n=1 Tax=Tetrapyrgos nigripes TaxID=182062 RepID=A0A8H5CUR5_9AGAR|nr:hypothetical protein D9758_010941 [Tetrapyrgos nigripes]
MNIFVKGIVYSVFILDLVSTIAITEASWLMLVSGWGRFENLHLVDWGFTTVPLWNSFSSALVQVFFGWRVWTLGSSHSVNAAEKMLWKAITVIIYGVSFAQVIGAIVSTARFMPINDLFRISICYPSTATWLICSAVADILITISMTVLLSRAMFRNRKDHISDSTRQTDALLNKIIRNTIETAAVTAGAAILELIFFYRLPNTGLHICIALVLSKLYSNTLFASLNARASFRREENMSSNQAGTEGPMSLTDSRFDHASNFRTSMAAADPRGPAQYHKKRLSDFTSASDGSTGNMIEEDIPMGTYGYGAMKPNRAPDFDKA